MLKTINKSRKTAIGSGSACRQDFRIYKLNWWIFWYISFVWVYFLVIFVAEYILIASVKTFEFIEEFKQGKRSCYRIQRKDESGQPVGSSYIVSCPLEFREKDGFVYAIPHDNDMQVVSDQFRFINYHHRGDSENTRRTTAQALRCYNCFKACFHITDDNLSPDMVDLLLIFLCGYDYNPQYFHFVTERDEASVRNQLSAIRTYLEYIGKPCAALERNRSITMLTKVGDMNISTTRTKYEVGPKADPHKNDYVPTHILPDEYRQLRTAAQARGDNQAVILFHLMYIYGLRLGECLSLTQEDITMVQNGSDIKPAIILRKRVGAKRWASAKTIMGAKSKQDYNTKREQTVTMLISMDFFKDLAKFIDSEIKFAKKRFPKKVEELEADICNPAEFGGEHNRFIFINHNRGGRLDNQSWNRKLKTYFLEVGLVLDSGARDKNLSHRFRHGCAMLYYRYIEEEKRLSLKELKDFMRHANIHTTMVYTKPTLADAAAIREKFQGELFETSQYLKF